MQTDLSDYTPSDAGYAAIKQVQQLLEARGVHFPVPHPADAFQARVRAEDAQRRVWEASVAEGQHWAAVLNEDDLSTGHAQQDLDHRAAAEEAFQAWRKTQPKWARSTTGGDAPLYSRPPSLEEEAATIAREQAAGQADSLKWAKQFKRGQ